MKKSEVIDNQQQQKQVAISTSVSDLTNIVAEIALDIEKVDVYISAIKKSTDNKYTPYDEVNEIKDILESVQVQSENLKRRYSDLLLFLSKARRELLLKKNNEK